MCNIGEGNTTVHVLDPSAFCWRICLMQSLRLIQISIWISRKWRGIEGLPPNVRVHCWKGHRKNAFLLEEKLAVQHEAVFSFSSPEKILLFQTAAVYKCNMAWIAAVITHVVDCMTDWLPEEAGSVFHCYPWHWKLKPVDSIIQVPTGRMGNVPVFIMVLELSQVSLVRTMFRLGRLCILSSLKGVQSWRPSGI